MNMQNALLQEFDMEMAHTRKTLERVPEIDRRACRRRVEQCFSIETMVTGYEQVYQKIFEMETNKS